MENFSVDLLLDAVKKANGWESDYKLAKSLGINPNAVSNYRSKRSLPDELTIQKLAAAGGLDADVLTAQVQAARSRNSETKNMWERIAMRLQSAAVTASVAVAFFFSPIGQDPHGALAVELPASFNLQAGNLYIVSICVIFATLVLAWILSD
jgi:transcriptional regulator with XRE-family HTH domain